MNIKMPSAILKELDHCGYKTYRLMGRIVSGRHLDGEIIDSMIVDMKPLPIPLKKPDKIDKKNIIEKTEGDLQIRERGANAYSLMGIHADGRYILTSIVYLKIRNNGT